MSKIIDAESYIKHDQEAGNGKTVLNRKQNKIIDADAENRMLLIREINRRRNESARISGMVIGS